MRHIAIVGGGIAGLSAAYHTVKDAHDPVKVTVLEALDYWGGKIVTERVDGFVIEGGPDTFVVTKPWAVKLCKELGIADRLQGTNPARKKTYILKGGRLHELPGGLTMMIPTEFGPLIRTGLLSWPAKIRMGLDFILPAAHETGDESMGAFVTRRLGRAAYENLIEPLMSGIYAGDGDALSLQATLPYLRELELQHGGLVKGALYTRKARAKNGNRPAPGSRSIFLTPMSGLAEIVEQLVAVLQDAGTDLRLHSVVQQVRPRESGYQLRMARGDALEVEGLILATPAYISGGLVADFAPALGEELRTIEYVSTATVTLAFPEAELPRLLDGYGYVIPRREGRKALACTWTSTKFPHRAPERQALVRVFIGRAGQEDQIAWDDRSLLAIAREELAMTLGIAAEPILTRIYRWERAMPQYNVGHLARLARLDEALRAYPALALAGNGYRGIGIPDCIRSGELAAARVLQQVGDLDKRNELRHKAIH